MEMTIKARSGTEEEKAYAAKVIFYSNIIIIFVYNQVMPLISRHHLLLVTLMLWNASATEALPVSDFIIIILLQLPFPLLLLLLLLIFLLIDFPE